VRRRRLIWQLFPSYLVITLLSLLAVTIYFTHSLRNFYENQTIKGLESRCRLLEPTVSSYLDRGDMAGLNRVVGVLGERSGTRITIIFPDGEVIADTDKPIEEIENHGDRPEVLEALAGRRGVITRFSDTVNQRMMYVALPLEVEDEVRVVIRASTPTSLIEHTLWDIYGKLAIAWLVISMIAAWVSWANARRISRPLEKMRLRATRIAGGDLSGRLPVEGSEEVGALADALNHMAEELDTQIKTILRQRREQKAVFSSISDGVLAIDADGLLISINKTAANLFGVDRKKVRGHTIQEVITNPDVRFFMMKALKTSEDVEDEIHLVKENRYLHAHGRKLIDESGNGMGAVVVLNDVTRLRHLEITRRDFVANVSHELRTPVTSIMGFVETLKSGALDDPETATRFVDIIARQASRLDAIIEDLLSLARIERDSESSDIPLYDASLAETVENAVQSMESIAGAKGIHIETRCNSTIRITANPPLLEQALTNLIENAIKYSDSGTPVEVTAEEYPTEVLLRVSDKGPGIAPDHLPRIFERFYRVDKGRSREVGGTGLGLAIVKHIMIAHGGQVEVTSTLGEGSRFTLRFPLTRHKDKQLSLLQA